MKTIIITAVVTVILVAGAIALGMLVLPILFPPSATPTAPVSATNPPPLISEIPSPTMISYPTYTYRPTSTPIPSPTSFLFDPYAAQRTAPATSGSGNPPPSSSGGSSGSNANCQAQLDYAASIHQYNLDVLEYIQQPMVDYWKSVLNQAVRDRDAYRVVQAQNALDELQADLRSDQAAENKRYKAEVARIKAAYCQ